MRVTLILGLLGLAITLDRPPTAADVAELIANEAAQIQADSNRLALKSSILDERRVGIEKARKVVDEAEAKLSEEDAQFRFHLSDSQVRAYNKYAELKNESSVSAFVKSLTPKQRKDLGEQIEQSNRVESARKALDDTVEQFNGDIEKYNREASELARRREALSAATDRAAAASAASQAAELRSTEALLNALQVLSRPSAPPITIECNPWLLNGVRCTQQ